MPLQASGPPVPRRGGAHPIGDIAELLDVLYENARQGAGTSAVSATQLRLLFLVDRRPGLRMRDLAQLLGATAPSMTRLCDRLEATGLLRRRPCPGNGREVILGLTPAGESHLAEIRATRERRLALALDAMPADGRQALARGLAALRHGITTTTAATTGTAGRAR